MPDLLLEFLSEEIPARMQARAAEDLQKMVTDRLIAAGLAYEGAKGFATPRRLALSVHGVPRANLTSKKKEGAAGRRARERHCRVSQGGGPPVDQAGKSSAGQEGRFLRCGDRQAGKADAGCDRRMIPDVVRNFPWPKSMRWGSGRLSWVRPLIRSSRLSDRKPKSRWSFRWISTA